MVIESFGTPVITDDIVGRRACAASGMAAACMLLVMRALAFVSLPYDAEYYTLIHLMWYGSESWLSVLVMLFRLMRVAVLLGALLCFTMALWPLRTVPLERRSLAMWTLLGSLYVFVAQQKGRLVSNLLYSLRSDRQTSGDLWLAELEGPVIAKLQIALDGQLLREAAAWMYSFGWLAALLLAFPIALLYRNRALAITVALGPVLVTALALPVHLAFPVHDPWSFNPAYGFAGSVATQVRYLYPAGDPTILLTVATSMRTVVASCLPSLHVALPAFMAAAFFAAGKRAVAWLFCLVTTVTAIVIVVLGRHWIADSAAAVAIAIFALASIKKMVRFGSVQRVP